MTQKNNAMYPEQTIPELRTSTSGKSLSSYRILVVDPSRDIRMLVATFLRGYGFAVETQPSGMEALLQFFLANDRFSLVITEIELSSALTGYDFTNHIRRIDSAIPVIAMTGQSVQFENIFDHVVFKPFHLRHLLYKCLDLLPDAVLPERWQAPQTTNL